MQRTTIAVSARVRDRLQLYGRKGMTYETILDRLMDAVAPDELGTGRSPQFETREVPAAEVDAWRRKTAHEKLEIAEGMRRMAEQANPKGHKVLVESRRTAHRRQ